MTFYDCNFHSRYGGSVDNTPIEIDISGLPDVGTRKGGNINSQAIMIRYRMEFSGNLNEQRIIYVTFVLYQQMQNQ